jgi:hypothetical protein
VNADFANGAGQRRCWEPLGATTTESVTKVFRRCRQSRMRTGDDNADAMSVRLPIFGDPGSLSDCTYGAHSRRWVERARCWGSSDCRFTAMLGKRATYVRWHVGPLLSGRRTPVAANAPDVTP